jgi:hypothetical protein
MQAAEEQPLTEASGTHKEGLELGSRTKGSQGTLADLVTHQQSGVPECGGIDEELCRRPASLEAKGQSIPALACNRNHRIVEIHQVQEIRIRRFQDLGARCLFRNVASWLQMSQANELVL